MDRVGPTIIGRRSTPGADAARDFLTRNEVPHRWVELDRDPLAPLLETASVTAGRLPLVLFPDGTRLEGPGDYAALYAASEGLRTLVCERDAPGGQAGTSSRIENYPGFPDGRTRLQSRARHCAPGADCIGRLSPWRRSRPRRGPPARQPGRGEQ